ncbi:hypothetical protein Moror_9166 [Moniliophthora roreri MCA 2997]|uniref:Uncharacterized protein n=1 Tax=Moniliophthora roreri (strain MCA 2997) TaxID=1381753 RepID=V2WKX9_MONRO|nr:hypothetical protein Moror_9166 [Moniliophthora roreri MCA 2997]
MKDSGPRQRTDTGILGDSSGQGDEVADIGGGSHGPRRQGSRADVMGQPTHDQEDMNEANVHRLGTDTGMLGDRDEVEVHGDHSYRLQSLRRQVSGSSNHREDAE